MREIKFRTWNKQHNKMYELQKMSFKTKKMLPYGWNMQYGEELFSVPMQFTGLKDRNHKEIYEGDIVEFVDLPNGDAELCIGEVIFEEFGWHFTNSITESSLASYESESVKVIGNIYENPELLKRG